jgi:hypothetical protein
VAVLGAVLTVTTFAAFNSPVYVRRVVVGGDLSVVGRVRALASLYPLAGPSTYVLQDTLLYVIAAVVGTNLAVVGYHLRRNTVGLRSGTGGAFGVVVGTLGAGCAPCGAAVFAGITSVLGVTTGVSALPLKGAEFLVLSLAVAVLSLYWVADGVRMADREVCPVDP